MRENWIRNEKIQCCKNAEEYFPLSCEIDAIGRIAKSVCLLTPIWKSTSGPTRLLETGEQTCNEQGRRSI